MSNKERLQRRHSFEPIASGLTAAENAASSVITGEVAKTGQFTGSESSILAATAERFTSSVAYLNNPAHWWVVGLIILISLGVFGKGLNYLEESARRQKAERTALPNNSNSENQSWLNAINPFVEPPVLPAALPLSKEYIYAGSRMLTVEDANANAAPPADLAVWRPSNGFWYVLGGPGSQQTSAQFGADGDDTVPGDYDGDGKTDFSVYRPSTGYWYIQRSSDNAFAAIYFGAASDKKAQADFDGDGVTDAAVFRPSDGTWYIQQSSAGFTSLIYGASTDLPAPADYDGDGKADLAMWRDSNQTFYIKRSSDGLYTSAQVGTTTGNEPVSADYDGDGIADPAVRSGTSWIIKQSSTNSTVTITPSWEQASDKVVPNDYDGDGKVDIAVWRESIGYWLIRQSSLVGQPGELRQVQWGAPGDIPVPAFYRR